VINVGQKIQNWNKRFELLGIQSFCLKNFPIFGQKLLNKEILKKTQTSRTQTSRNSKIIRKIQHGPNFFQFLLIFLKSFLKKGKQKVII
jgi:hypothetical protein